MGASYHRRMTEPQLRSVDGITRDEAAAILAVHVATVDRLVRHGGLSRGRKYATGSAKRRSGCTRRCAGEWLHESQVRDERSSPATGQFTRSTGWPKSPPARWDAGSRARC